MAFNLTAVLRLKDDGFTSKMRRMQRATEQMNNSIRKVQRSTGLWRDANGRLRDSMGRFAKETERASWNLTRLGNGLRNVAKETSGIRGLVGQFTALATAIGGAYAAKKIFDSTVLAAAKHEQSTVMINAMINDKAIAKQYMDLIDRISVRSPILNSQDVYANSKSFLTISKNIKQLEKMWSLAERLAAISPDQGVEGAVFALRELFSGDAVSMVERFEMPRKVMNEIKKMDLPKQLDALDRYFNKIGLTTKLVNDMGSTTLGLWNRVREQFQLVLREMGKPSLEVLSGFLTQILQKLESGDFSRFAQIGARMIKSILGGLTNGIISIYNWFDTITKSPEFQKRTTLWGKVQFVIGDLYQKFLEWLKDRGAKQIASATSDLILALSSALQQNAGPLTAAALTVGVQVGSAIAQGIMSAIASNPIANMIFGGAGTVAGIAKHYYDKFFGGKESKKRSGSTSRNYRLFKERQLVRGYAGGLNYVPYDRFPALLHRGEMVLPRGEAQEYRKGRASGVSVTISGNTFHVRQDSDIQKIAYELAKLIEREGALMANVR
ncbi:hypothetical protein [Geobacillus vulcani]|uniref:hypothetical protein n=1 Tax=Geobacillus vulcani TaxID=135517 RepID=UPI0004DF43C4|nr:hypothetical protein [Geobacillus vulcani]